MDIARFPGLADAWQPLSAAQPALRTGRALVLALDEAAFASLPPVLAIDGCRFEAKREHHVTLLDRHQVSRVLDAGAQACVRDSIAELNWCWRAHGAPWLLRREPPRAAWSLIQPIDQPAQDEFRERLRRAGVATGAAFPHVTLYTRGDPVGIGVADVDAFAQRRVRALSAAECTVGGRDDRTG